MKYTRPGRLLTNRINLSFAQYLKNLHYTGQFSFLCLSVAIALILFSLFSTTGAQIEVTVDENRSNPTFNGTPSEDAEPKPDILYSKLHKDTIVGEVLNNFTYPIELVRITATVYGKDGVITATGDKYVNDYLIKPGDKSGFDIFLDQILPSNSKYTLTTSYKKSDDIKLEALQLSIGKNSKTSKSFRVLGEVVNQGNSEAKSVKVSAIFYDAGHKVVDTDYVYTNPDIISPNRKAPFEFSFQVENPEKIRYMSFNVQSDEYSLVTNKGQNNTTQ